MKEHFTDNIPWVSCCVSVFPILITIHENIHSGGGASNITSMGNQEALNVSVKALKQNYQTGTPLVLLVDDQYSRFPYDLSKKKISYAVLGWFTITNSWGMFFLCI